MLEFSFQIKLAMPVAMTPELRRPITVAIRPRWRVTAIEMRRLQEDVFGLKLVITSEDDREPSRDELIEFRDLIVSLVAFSAMVPVHLRSKGTFDFPVDGEKRKVISLGSMNYRFPLTPLSDLQPLAMGLVLPPKYQSALHFLWQALNSEHSLYRFINLAVAVELLVRHDSAAEGFRHPKCPSSKCGYLLDHCPSCKRPWKIQSTLRQRSAFLLPEPILSEFISARNSVFHGLADDLHHGYAGSLPDLNMALLVVLRNYLGQQIGVPNVSQEMFSVALNPPDVFVTVFYTPQPT